MRVVKHTIPVTHFLLLLLSDRLYSVSPPVMFHNDICHLMSEKTRFWDNDLDVRPSKSNKNPCWMNRAASSARKYKSRMWIRFRESQSFNDLVEYKIAQNKAVKEYRKAKKEFERNLVKNIKSNPRSFYAYVRSKTKVKEVVGPIKDINDQFVSDNGVMCEILNEC